MALIPVVHGVKLASGAEAEAFFRSLRLFTTPRIALRGLRTTDLKRIVRVVQAIDPPRNHAIDFEGGSLTGPARAALLRLASGKFQFLHVATLGAELRVWPWLHARVHSDRRFPRAFGDAEVKVTPHGHDLETTAVDTAVGAFLDVADARITRGHITELAGPTKPALLDFLRELQGIVRGSLEVDVATARALTELYAGDALEWQADGITVRFPEGTIEGLMASPQTTEDDRRKVVKRLDKALARAGLRKA